jgi:uncharacterized protein YeaO (DUF488 family)
MAWTNGQMKPGRDRSSHIRTKRAYEPPGESDGYRVLVDRLWPRGVAREDLAIDGWHKEIAPSDGLRRWFNHDPARWPEFVERYRTELQAPGAAAVLDDLARRAKTKPLTLVYGARDGVHNNAAVVRDEIAGRLRGKAGR